MILTGRTRPIRKQTIAPAILIAATVACTAGAALLGRPAWAAAVGAGLVVAYWALEAAVWKRAGGRPGLALGTAVGGMVLRLTVVLAALVAVALVARPSFATTIVCFALVFTLYAPVRLFTSPDTTVTTDGARAS